MDLKQTGANYDQIAAWWTEQMRGSDYGMDYVRRAMGLAKEKCRVLDIGCGSTGRVIDEAKRRGFEITSLDLSGEMIRIAREKHPDAVFIEADFADWQADRKYDLIIAWDSVFHAPIDQQVAITKKMCGLLDDEGFLLFTAGSHYGEASGEMQGCMFEYGTIGYPEYLRIMDEMGCRIILMEEDQYPAGHMVFWGQKRRCAD